MPDSFAIPDFVVVGAQVGGEVILLASNKMSEAELKEELRYPDLLTRYDRFEKPPEYDIRIIAKVYDYIMVKGKDYPEAWQTLFKAWSPENVRRAELPGGTREIGSS